MMTYIWWSLPLTLALLNPLLVAMVVIIPFLLLTGIPYEHYFKGSEVLNDLLQPAGNCTRFARVGNPLLASVLSAVW